MDELTFRRTIYADPNTQDPEVIAAAKADPAKQAFWNEVKALDNQIFAASQIKVPENLAEKLLLKQSFEEREEERNKRPWYIAMAASVAVAAVLTFNVMQPISGNALANDVFAHVDEAYVAKEMMMSTGNVDREQVNAKMATFNASLDGDLGNVVSANYCYLDKIKSLHLIIKGENGLINMFVMPEDLTESLQETFNSATMFGTSFLLESAKIIIVGEDGEEVKNVKESAKQTLRFSA